MDSGLLYVATGEAYIKEARQSAQSFKAHMPDIPIALFTDDVTMAGNSGIFNHVEQLEDPQYSYIDKILVLKSSPFDKTIFLDTDTCSIAPCYELFHLLDYVDFAAAHDPVRYCWTLENCPECFPELNTGVIAFRNSKHFNSLVDDWHAIYRHHQQMDQPPPHDQPAFREAAFRSPARFSVLAPEYNLRTCYPYMIGGRSSAKIIHDRGEDLQQALAIHAIDSKHQQPCPRVITKNRIKRQCGT